MRTLGLGWKDLTTPWSQNGQELSPRQLSDHLKMIILQEQTRVVPDEPPVLLPARKTLPTLGTEAPDVAAMELSQAADTSAFWDRAKVIRLEREAAGVGDRHAEMQPTSHPAIDSELVGQRLEVCFEYEMKEADEDNLAWCQGVVVAVSDGTNLTRKGNELLDGTESTRKGRKKALYKPGEAVRIRWDDNEEMEDEEKETNERLLPSKWNPKGNHRAGCWRLDFGGSPA